MYHYKVTFYDELSENKKIITDTGITSGGNAGEAINKLIEFYGKKQIISIDEFYELEEILTKTDLSEI